MTSPNIGRLILVLAAVATTLLGAQASESRLDELRRLALDLVNADRKSEGLGPLGLDQSLCRAAQDHAEDMLDRGYFDHRSPEGNDVMDRYFSAGGNRWLRVAENIYKCDGCAKPPNPKQVRIMHGNWMDSPPHRANILSPSHAHYCFGLAANATIGYTAVQTFAGPGMPPSDGSDRVPRALSAAQLRNFALALINRERRDRESPPLKIDDALSADAEAFLQAELTRDPDGVERLNTGRLREFLSGHEAGKWLKVGMLVDACGGCGVEPTDVDVTFFTAGWLRDQDMMETVLDRSFDNFGMAMAADGKGRKIIVGLFGDHGG